MIRTLNQMFEIVDELNAIMCFLALSGSGVIVGARDCDGEYYETIAIRSNES